MPPSPADLPQTPSGDQIFLDHVGWFVPDMEAAGRAFEALGFTLTPFVAQHNADPAGGPPNPAGTGNRWISHRSAAAIMRSRPAPQSMSKPRPWHRSSTTATC